MKLNLNFSELAREGYLLVPEAISRSCTDQLLRAISELPTAHAHRNLLEFAHVRQFAHSNEALRLITPVLGATPFAVRGILFDKLPGANWKVAWHQDLSIAVKKRHDVEGFGPWSVKEEVPHVQPPTSILENMLTLRVHLDDCFEDNGPVRVLSGTHRFGILSPEQIQQQRQEHSEVIAISPARGALLMCPLLLHASSAALAPCHRRVVHIEYAAEPLPAPLEWY